MLSGLIVSELVNSDWESEIDDNIVMRSVVLNIGVSPRNQVSDTVILLAMLESMYTLHSTWRELPISAYSTGGAEMVTFGVETAFKRNTYHNKNISFKYNY